MAKTFTAPFAQTPQIATAVCTGAVTLTGASSYADDSPNNTQLLLTAGADGALLTNLQAIARATVTASQLMVWASTDNGTTKRLIASALMPAYTLAATTQNVPTVFKHPDNSTTINDNNPVRLAAGEKLYVGSAVALASGIVFNARYTDF